jgi:hypothetical protein
VHFPSRALPFARVSRRGEGSLRHPVTTTFLIGVIFVLTYTVSFAF